jgi:hypothetical protein
LVVSALITTGAASAHAQSSCGRAGHPWVSVAFSGGGLDPKLKRAVLLDLRAGLKLKGIDACPLGHEGSNAPLAVIELSAEDPTRVIVSIEIHDAVTEKRVLRDLDLSTITDDARPLTIAAAADELMRASWAELALADAPTPTSEPPSVVTDTVKAAVASSPLRPKTSTAHALGARGALEHHSAGHTQLGADVYAGLWILERIGFELGVGLRRGLTRKGTHGEVGSSALVGTGELRFALLPRDQDVELDALIGIAVANVRFRGEAGVGAESAAGAGIDVHARAGLSAQVLLSRALRLRALASAGAPLRSVEATDASKVVASTGGIELRAAAGLEIAF